MGKQEFDAAVQRDIAAIVRRAESEYAAKVRQEEIEAAYAQRDAERELQAYSELRDGTVAGSADRFVANIKYTGAIARQLQRRAGEL